MIHNPNLNAAAWYVFRSAVKCEKKAVLGLQEAGFTAYTPELKKWVHHARKRYAALRPLFVGYGFVLVDPAREGFYHVRKVYGVDDIIGNQGLPMPIRSAVVENLMTAQRQGLFDETAEKPVVKWKHGQRVQIISGLGEGRLGKILRANDKGRVELLMDMLGARVSVDSAALAEATE